MKLLLPMLAALLCVGCGTVPQRESNKTVAAFDIPLPSLAERHRFLDVLRREAGAAGFHVDSATDEELDTLSQVVPLTMNATIWRGDNDEEIIASALSAYREQGRIWITFSKGENPDRSAAFRQRLMQEIIRLWPETLALPIMPTGAIPLPEDMLRTPSGYVVKPSEEYRYQLPKAPPAAPR